MDVLVNHLHYQLLKGSPLLRPQSAEDFEVPSSLSVSRVCVPQPPNVLL